MKLKRYLIEKPVEFDIIKQLSLNEKAKMKIIISITREALLEIVKLSMSYSGVARNGSNFTLNIKIL